MTISTLVDSNVLIDVLGPETIPMRRWSLGALKQAHEEGPIVFSPVVWAELAGPSLSEEALMRAFAWLKPRCEALPFDAAHPAGRVHSLYRLRGGQKERTLPDFLIGAHALIRGYRLLTRDAIRYRTYFPSLSMISPDTHR